MERAEEFLLPLSLVHSSAEGEIQERETQHRNRSSGNSLCPVH